MSHWQNWQQFWAMGGYAAYVWPAYGIGLAILLGNYGSAWLKYRQQLKKLAARQHKINQSKDNIKAI